MGSECEHHQDIHLFEDTTLVENVDPDGQPVPAGQPGARLLVTTISTTRSSRCSAWR
jgi:phenylacetate-CoA ligase